MPKSEHLAFGLRLQAVMQRQMMYGPKDLAAETGIHQRSCYRYCRGEAVPTALRLVQMQAALPQYARALLSDWATSKRATRHGQMLLGHMACQGLVMLDQIADALGISLTELERLLLGRLAPDDQMIGRTLGHLRTILNNMRHTLTERRSAAS